MSLGLNPGRDRHALTVICHRALKECGAGSKGFSAIFHDEARAEPAEVPALLTRSSAPWMQSGPLPSAGQGPTSSEESNAESARNEAELKTQLELIQVRDEPRK